ncbi:putative permease family protein [Mycobacterium kansasii]|uniref:Putative permease family protein n=1 Tax=Mycobacterium kansasii TaxID=1768 RepID=A0A1V3XUB1_MYCKA|nr:putative permease family protein [Mycobacterium kansasii]
MGHALALAGSMTWEILWALILGFALSAMVQAVVRRETIVALMGDDKPRTLAVAAGLGPHRRRARMRRWRWRGRCFGKARTSPPPWHSRSVPPIWSWSWASSWRC